MYAATGSRLSDPSGLFPMTRLSPSVMRQRIGGRASVSVWESLPDGSSIGDDYTVEAAAYTSFRDDWWKQHPKDPSRRYG